MLNCVRENVSISVRLPRYSHHIHYSCCTECNFSHAIEFTNASNEWVSTMTYTHIVHIVGKVYSFRNCNCTCCHLVHSLKFIK